MFNKSIRSVVDERPRFVVTEETGARCSLCGEDYPLRRKALGYDTCLACSKEKPKLCNMHLHKQAATYTANVDVVRENQYGAHK